MSTFQIVMARDDTAKPTAAAQIDERIVVNMGPQHPSTHGVLRLILEIEGETVTDLQLGYTFQSGALENLSFLLQVNNLENEPFRSNFGGNSTQPREYFEYGRTYLFGVNYRF